MCVSFTLKSPPPAPRSRGNSTAIAAAITRGVEQLVAAAEAARRVERWGVLLTECVGEDVDVRRRGLHVFLYHSQAALYCGARACT